LRGNSDPRNQPQLQLQKISTLRACSSEFFCDPPLCIGNHELVAITDYITHTFVLSVIMPGIKRKAGVSTSEKKFNNKKPKAETRKPKEAKIPDPEAEAESDSDPIIESDTGTLKAENRLEETTTRAIRKEGPERWKERCSQCVKLVERSTCKAKGREARAKSSKAKRRLDCSIQEDLGATSKTISRAAGGTQGIDH
jgi:hypothetical protein